MTSDEVKTALIIAVFVVVYVGALYLFWCAVRMTRAWWLGGDWLAELRKGSNVALGIVVVGVIAIGTIWTAQLWAGGPN